jgi:hypothetical protein
MNNNIPLFKILLNRPLFLFPSIHTLSTNPIQSKSPLFTLSLLPNQSTSWAPVLFSYLPTTTTFLYHASYSLLSLHFPTCILKNKTQSGTLIHRSRSRCLIPKKLHPQPPSIPPPLITHTIHVHPSTPHYLHRPLPNSHTLSSHQASLLQYPIPTTYPSKYVLSPSKPGRICKFLYSRTGGM